MQKSFKTCDAFTNLFNLSFYARFVLIFAGISPSIFPSLSGQTGLYICFSIAILLFLFFKQKYFSKPLNNYQVLLLFDIIVGIILSAKLFNF